MTIEVIQADYHNPQHGQDLLALLDAYARDPMGGGEGLKEQVKATLLEKLAERADAVSLLCYVDGEPAGLINAFEGFSTFKAKPLFNIHDVVVLAPFRGRGLSLAMLDKLSEVARARGCCKLTLEVLEGNTVAKAAYLRFGFVGYELDPAMGKAVFFEKAL
ncbi:GNAT family N-acetyltransferase [Gallaecimonas sp. GXIMD1310]|uniref:GNAT family N-acetyltransferase n=1 Tax=Gallaecimonas sp. GXIMD1310 TaxID=3131926 RepID=UPI003243099F